MANTKNVIRNDEAVFEKAAFLSSKSFEKQRDLLNVILEDDKKYTTKEVRELLKKEKIERWNINVIRWWNFYFTK